MTDAWLAALQATLGERVHTRPAELAAVARDASHVIGRPEALIYPETSAHVAAAVRIAHQHRVPIVPRGGGTSLTGATVPTRGGLVIAFNRMQSLIALDVEERTALVQPGHPNAALDREARRHGLRYTPDPSSRATSVIGGNIGTNAGGLHCLGHGVTGDHVLGLEVVLGDGTIAWLEDTDASDLRALVTGSEGTLAIVTCALVRLLPLPECLAVVVAGFERLEQAGACAERMVLEAPGLVACEFIDDAMLRALDHLAPGVLPVNVEAALLIEVEALREGIDRAIAVVVQCVEEAGGSAREARSDEEIEIAWNARRSAACIRIRTRTISRLPAIVLSHRSEPPPTSRSATISSSRRSRTWEMATSTLGCTTTRVSPGRSSARWRPARNCSSWCSRTAAR
jgi:FAD/FMN-containing dehydrogenase